MNPKLIFTALLFSTFLFSCQNPAEKNLLDTSLNQVPLAEPTPEEQQKDKQQIRVGKPLPEPGSKAPTSQPPSHLDWDKKIIKIAALKLEVKDFKQYNTQLHETIRRSGGYIATEEQNLTEEKSETSMSIKVPVEQFEGLMNQLAATDNKILERKITSEDVSGEVVDTRSRLEAKRQVRLKYLEFLKESKNMEDVLKVQAEINSIQEAMEAAAGRIEYLSHQSAFSTINLVFFQRVKDFKPVDANPAFFTRVTLAFKSGAVWVGDLFIGLITLWPMVLLVAGAFLLFRYRIALKTNTQKP